MPFRPGASRFRGHDERPLETLFGLHHEALARRIGVATEARRGLHALFEADGAALRERGDEEWRGAGPRVTLSGGSPA